MPPHHTCRTSGTADGHANPHRHRRTRWLSRSNTQMPPRVGCNDGFGDYLTSERKPRHRIAVPGLSGTDQFYFLTLARSSRASFKCALPEAIAFFANVFRAASVPFLTSLSKTVVFS